MAAPEITSTGINIQTFDEIFTQLVDSYKAIYGIDIDLSQDTQDGQRVGIEAKALHDLQQLAVSIYYANDPDLANNDALQSIIKLAGIRKKAASQSSWDLDVTTDRALTLPEGYSVIDDVGQTWTIASPTVFLSATTQTVTFLSDVYGDVEGLSGATIKQATVQLGVTAIAAPADATAGQNEETDQDLRTRRRLSVQNPSRSTYGGLYAKLADLAGVTGLEIYENDTDTYDATLDLEARHYWIVIEGGDVTAIAETAAKQKTGGAGMKGGASGQWIETLTRPNGTSKTKVHTAFFDRPTIKPLYVNVTATRKDAAVPIDTSAIADAIATRTYNIGQRAIASELYCEGYTAGTTFILSDLQISDDNVTFTDEDIDVGFDGRFEIDAVNVTVTEVV